jgi:predicted nucleotidyltransferase
MITYEDSVMLVRKLRELSSEILGIELFGSVLRNGYGRDADFLILVKEKLAKYWWEKERESIRVRWPDILYKHRWIIKKYIPFVYATIVHNRRKNRLKISADILGINLKYLINADGSMPDFEMFLVPAKWRIGSEINIDLMQQITDLVNDRNTHGFLKRIAREATPLS